MTAKRTEERVCVAMKILITSDWYEPVINGVVTSVSNLCRGLTKAGHEVKILTLSDSIHARREGNVYYLGSVNMEIIYPNARVSLNWRRFRGEPERRGTERGRRVRPLWHISSERAGNGAFLRELIAWGPEVVHSQCEFSTFLFARKIAERCGAPLVHTYHTVYEEYTHYFCPSRTLGERLAAKFSREILDRTQAVIVPSGKMAKMMERYGVETPVHVIPSGICLEKYGEVTAKDREEVRRRSGISGQEFLFLYAGRLAREKRLEEIFSFLKELEDPNWRLLIVGDGPYRSTLERKAKELGITERLVFAGMVPQQEIQRYYSAGDVFVNASDSETQGLTYMEAMASGLPLLCRRDDCLEDVVRFGENGFLYETKKEFLETAALLQNNRKLRAEIGERARQTVLEKYSVVAFAAACMEVYGCIGRSRGSVR